MLSTFCPSRLQTLRMTRISPYENNNEETVWGPPVFGTAELYWITFSGQEHQILLRCRFKAMMWAILVIPRNAWTHRTPMERKAQPSVNKPAHPEPTEIFLGCCGHPRRGRFKVEAEGASSESTGNGCFKREVEAASSESTRNGCFEAAATSRPGYPQSKSMV